MTPILRKRYVTVKMDDYYEMTVSKDFNRLITGAQAKAGTGLKMQTVRFFNVTLLGIYRWLVTFGSARWLIEILSTIFKSTKHGGQSRERL